MTSTRTPTRSALDAAPRDQQESAFASLLADLVLSLPGARAAVLVDAGGRWFETTADCCAPREPGGEVDLDRIDVVR